ncbi:hypothetical protein EI015_26500, partial [Escherichia coli]|nr:hypothetical protein [Escherichia coli]
MAMVLMDDKGDKIHASVYSFQYFGVAANGGSYRTCRQTYKLNFQFTTKVVKMETDCVGANIYDFVPILQITGGGLDTDFLVDVMGLLTAVGTE